MSLSKNDLDALKMKAESAFAEHYALETLSRKKLEGWLRAYHEDVSKLLQALANAKSPAEKVEDTFEAAKREAAESPYYRSEVELDSYGHYRQRKNVSSWSGKADSGALRAFLDAGEQPQR